MIPLLLTATATRPVICQMGGPNIASLLAWSVAEERGMVATRDSVSQIDLPLVCLWRDADGWPLWAATDIYPVGPQTISRQWLHKRFPADRAWLSNRMKVSLVAGPFKERRVPVAAIACHTWQGVVLATDAAEVGRLIQRVRSIGSRSAAGFGAVHSWRVERCEADVDFVLARRNVPVDSGLRTGKAARMPWTPPYWHAGMWADCVGAQPCF